MRESPQRAAAARRRVRSGPEGRRRRAGGAALLAACLALPAQAREPRLELVFDRFNGTYENLSPEIVPVDTGALGLRLRSERNSVQLFAHRLVLKPRRGGGHEVSAWAEMQADADLEVELLVAGLTNSLRDEVAAPRQRLAVVGAVEVEPIPEGYLLTILEAPPVIELAIESELGRRLVLLCQSLPFAGAGCRPLDRALSTVRLPMPRPGERFELPAAELLPGERRQLDRYLRSARAE